MSNLKNPIFVVGTQRSGTTLLCRMLSAHPDIFIQNELNVRKMFSNEWSRDDIASAIKGLIQEDHGKDLETLLKQANKIYWGLKDPELTGHLEDLEKFLPESKFIVIIRDGRAVVNSYMENKWGLGTNAYTGARRWTDEVTQQLAFNQRHQKNVHLLKYENLVENTEHELSSLMSFLAIPFHNDMLQYRDKPVYYHQTRENLHTYRKPDTKLAARWRQKLSPRQKRIIELVAGDMLVEFGYKLEEEKIQIGAIEKAYYLLHQRIIGELQIQYRWRMSMIREHFRKKSLAE